MTFNIREGGVHGQFSKVVEAIRKADADVVGLQEPFGRTRKLAQGARLVRRAAAAHDLAVPDPAARGQRRVLGVAAGRARQGRHDREHPQPVVSLQRQHDASGHGDEGRDPPDRATRPRPVDAAVPGFTPAATRRRRSGVLHRRLQRPVVARLDARGRRRARMAAHDPPLPRAAVLGALADVARDGAGGVPRFVPRGAAGRDRRAGLHVDVRPSGHLPVGRVRPDRLRVGGGLVGDAVQPRGRRRRPDVGRGGRTLAVRPSSRGQHVRRDARGCAGVRLAAGRARPDRPARERRVPQRARARSGRSASGRRTTTPPSTHPLVSSAVGDGVTDATIDLATDALAPGTYTLALVDQDGTLGTSAFAAVDPSAPATIAVANDPVRGGRADHRVVDERAGQPLRLARPPRGRRHADHRPASGSGATSTRGSSARRGSRRRRPGTGRSHRAGIA